MNPIGLSCLLVLESIFCPLGVCGCSTGNAGRDSHCASPLPFHSPDSWNPLRSSWISSRSHFQSRCAMESTREEDHTAQSSSQSWQSQLLIVTLSTLPSGSQNLWPKEGTTYGLRPFLGNPFLCMVFETPRCFWPAPVRTNHRQEGSMGCDG